MQLPVDYIERVYAGVLGKIIGVYLGRPFEGWSYERIQSELGDIWYYVHDKRGVPLIVTDDDISGTFTFLRALPDFGNRKDITPEQIGHTWLNYLIENRTVLWWGGLGNSTEHTAYLRLKQGILPPQSGSIALNGKVVAEQIGAQIFIDGWAMVSPGNPELAADLARRAASVSHDGEAVYGAQVLAAMEAQAFIEPDIFRLIEVAKSLIPENSIIFRLINDLLEWHSCYSDWREARQKIVQNYGYDRYSGNCHIVPNHALIILGLLYGEDDFQKSLMITNTSGWDTDCNSGNIGCLMGIKNGLPGIDSGPDWRGPVADQFYLPTADGGSCITDAGKVTYEIVNIGRALAGLPAIAPKDGARFHFELPGAVQSFRPIPQTGGNSPLQVENVMGNSRLGTRSLAFRYAHTAPGQPAQASTPVFLPPEALQMPGYSLFACPTLYPGQIVFAEIVADEKNPHAAHCRLFIQPYSSQGGLAYIFSPETILQAGDRKIISWRIPACGGQPIATIGLEIQAAPGSPGSLYLDSLTWTGTPETVFLKPEGSNDTWRYAWVNAVDRLQSSTEAYRLIQNEGTGLIIQGTNEWEDYFVEADITPHMVVSAGLAARVQGLRRYYALMLESGDRISLKKQWYGTQKLLREANLKWEFGQTLQLGIKAKGAVFSAFVNGSELFTVKDVDNPILSGAIGLVCVEGRTATQRVSINQV
jgi:ADP-ribosylglycohydrolase